MWAKFRGMDDGNERDVSCVCLLDPLLLLLLILTYVTTGVSLVIWCRLLHHSENLYFPQTSSCPMPRIVGQRFRTELSLSCFLELVCVFVKWKESSVQLRPIGDGFYSSSCATFVGSPNEDEFTTSKVILDSCTVNFISLIHYGHMARSTHVVAD